MLTRKLNKIFKNKAQSILELAIFGSIIVFLLSVLIQYGLSLNAQQHLSMQTFRKALQIAKQRSTTAPEVSLTTVKDMPIPDPANPFGIAETSPVMASSSVVVSRDINAEPDIRPSDVPKIDIMINGQLRTYTTGAFIKYDIPSYSSYRRKKKTDYSKVHALTSWDTVVGPLWYWDPVEENSLATGDVIEILPGGKPMQIVKTEPDEGTPEAFWYLDPRAGQIDTTIQPEEGTPQGLQPGYTKETTTEASIEKTETGSGISTTRQATIIETIKRIIKTNQGDEPVSTEVKQDKSSSW